MLKSIISLFRIDQPRENLHRDGLCCRVEESGGVNPWGFPSFAHDEKNLVLGGF
jgi:hypothetical protein